MYKDNSHEFARLVTAGLPDDDYIVVFGLGESEEQSKRKDKSNRKIFAHSVKVRKLEQFLSDFHRKQGWDYYIASNTYFAPYGRNQQCSIRTDANLLHLSSIVVDIDFHTEKIPVHAFDYAAETFINCVMRNIVNDYDIPAPSVSVKTGRGVQLWWLINPVDATPENKKKWQLAAKILTEVLQFAGTYASYTQDAICPYTVDASASKRMSGLFRFAGTQNSKSNTKSVWQKNVSGRYDFDTLLTSLANCAMEYAPDCFKEDSEDDPANAPRRSNKGVTDVMTNNVLKSLIKLRKMRDKPAGEENRHTFCLIFFSILQNLDISESERDRRMKKFNAGFKEPYSERRLKNLLCSAKRKHYRYSIKKIKEELDMTEQEFFLSGLRLTTELGAPPRTTPAQTRSKKRKRDATICKLRQSGMTQEEIAKKVKVSRSTVQRVLNENHVADRTTLIGEMHDNGASIADIQKALNISASTVRRHLKKYTARNAEEEQQREAMEECVNTPAENLTEQETEELSEFKMLAEALFLWFDRKISLAEIERRLLLLWPRLCGNSRSSPSEILQMLRDGVPFAENGWLCWCMGVNPGNFIHKTRWRNRNEFGNRRDALNSAAYSEQHNGPFPLFLDRQYLAAA